MRLSLFPSVLLAGALAIGAAQAAEGLKVETLAGLNRVSDPQMSPNGRQVVYVMRETDMDANRGRTDLWLVSARKKDAQPERLVPSDASESNPRWSADGRSIYFLSSRSGSNQVWRYHLETGALAQITDLPLDVSNLVLAPNMSQLAVTMEVYADCDTLQCTLERQAREDEKVSTGRVYDSLLFRHWDQWEDGLRTQLYTLALDGDGLVSGEPVNVTAGLNGDVAAVPFGGVGDIAFGADGSKIYFSMRLVTHDEAWSTNYDIYEAPSAGGTQRNLTEDNQAYDGHPVISRDGRYMAYLAMEIPRYEADRQRIVMLDLENGTRRTVTENWDRSVGSLAFLNGNSILIASAGDLGQRPLWAINARSGSATRLTGKGSISGFSIGDSRIAYVHHSLGSPGNVYTTTGDGRKPRQLTDVNAELLADTALADFEQYQFAGWNDETVYGYVMKPANYEEGKKYPVAYIIHGGPQGSFGNSWSYRWNPQTYAGAGYGVVFIDFHGSTGYGQEFTDSINKDWGGKPLEDWQKGLAAALSENDWLDGDNVCALGASYGGYAMTWIAGNWPDRFKCLVNHAGVSELRSMYYTTEELWFVEREFGGPYYDQQEAHEKHNPFNHVKNWKTPMLVIQGGQDFRVPEHQSFATFTALQRQGVPSKFLYFPDENHWILKPANSIHWHHEVLDWMDHYLKGDE